VVASLRPAVAPLHPGADQKPEVTHNRHGNPGGSSDVGQYAHQIPDIVGVMREKVNVARDSMPEVGAGESGASAQMTRCSRLARSDEIEKRR